MKRIFLSLITIAAVSLVGFGATKAYFTDTETKTGNTFATGTIDISVDNPEWQSPTGYALADMKPSQTDYIDFTVHNIGTNPVNLYKTLTGFVSENAIQTPAELIADPTGQKNDVESVINYDLTVELYKNDPNIGGQTKVWWQTIYLDEDNVTLALLKDKPIYLGMIPAGWYLKVIQSYHMNEETGNEYQGDKLTFNIKLDAEQLGKSKLILENKEEVQYGGYSHTILNDNKYAELTYKVKDRKFDYELKVYGMTADGVYTLIKYDDPLDGTDPWPAPNSLALANVTINGGNGIATGNIELNQNLLNAKVWLVKANYTPGSFTGNLSWDPTNTLFETGLMDYYDADL